MICYSLVNNNITNNNRSILLLGFILFSSSNGGEPGLEVREKEFKCNWQKIVVMCASWIPESM